MKTSSWILLGAALFLLMTLGVARHGATLDGERARGTADGATYP